MARLASQPPAEIHGRSYGNSALIDSVAVTLQAPCLLIVETEPFRKRRRIVEALSERLRCRSCPQQLPAPACAT